MTRSFVIPMSFILAAGAQANCIPDSEEIGDIGPGASQICQSLDVRFQNADIRIVEREIQAADRVSITITVDGETQSLPYRLVGADWVQMKTQFVDRGID